MCDFHKSFQSAVIFILEKVYFRGNSTRAIPRQGEVLFFLHRVQVFRMVFIRRKIKYFSKLMQKTFKSKHIIFSILSQFKMQNLIQ